MAFMLCKRPDVLEKLREEVKDVKEVSFDSLRTLSYTFAFMKEVLR
jgi:cytochrome P450